MSLKSALWAFSLLIVCSPSTIIGQEQGSLRQQVVASVARRENKWHLIENTALDGTKTVGFEFIYLGWTFGNNRADASIEIYPNAEDAAKSYPTAFHGCTDCFVRPTVLAVKIPNLGDDSYVWEDRDWRTTGIVFRKGKVLISIEASEKAIATRLAFYVAKEITP